jgi:hypothetical protein
MTNTSIKIGMDTQIALNRPKPKGLPAFTSSRGGNSASSWLVCRTRELMLAGNPAVETPIIPVVE